MTHLRRPILWTLLRQPKLYGWLPHGIDMMRPSGLVRQSKHLAVGKAAYLHKRRRTPSAGHDAGQKQCGLEKEKGQRWPPMPGANICMGIQVEGNFGKKRGIINNLGAKIP